MQLRDQDIPLRSWLHEVSPHQVLEALTLHTLRSITGISYCVSFLKIHEWSKSFRVMVRGRVVGVFHQAVYHAHQKGTLHF